MSMNGTPLINNPRAVETAILSLLGVHDGIEASWCDERKRYLAEPKYADYWNGREAGYAITLDNLFMRDRASLLQLNIVFFEHRNSDNLCALLWESGVTINPPTIEDVTANKPEYAEDKYATDVTFAYNELVEFADWIHAQMENWWETKLEESKS